MTQAQVVHNLDGSTTEYTDIPLTPGRLERLLRELFVEHWQEIVFGLCIQGAVFEIRLTESPRKISMFDGYLTVDTGAWHMHLCIDGIRGAITGDHSSTPNFPSRLFQDSRSDGCVRGT